MSNFRPGIPGEDEYLGFNPAYVAKAASAFDPIATLTEQRDEVIAFLSPLTADLRQHRYAPGKWTIQEVIGHIIDAERIFAYRALRIGRADETPLPGFDENRYADTSEAAKCSWSELIDEFRYVRSANILLFKHLPDQAWTRRGTSNNTPVSVRALAYIMIGHVAHHLDILRDRYL